MKTEDSAVGFYALNGESLVKWTEDETKEGICGVLEKIREQHPGKRILLVLDKHGLHVVNSRAGAPINSGLISVPSIRVDGRRRVPQTRQRRI